MSRNIIKLRELILEIGELENIKSYEYSISDSNAHFRTKDNWIVKCNIDEVSVEGVNFTNLVHPDDLMVYNISYSVNDNYSQHKKSNIGELFRILKTILDICKIWILKREETHSNILYLIFSESKNASGDADLQKTKYYEIIISKNIPAGYRLIKVNVDGLGDGLGIYKIVRRGFKE